MWLHYETTEDFNCVRVFSCSDSRSGSGRLSGDSSLGIRAGGAG
ncbi:hypothetical protein MGSAQ_000631 [marine sediment metagenome]|uniref:Uncharacterized protein n=1 Tax=marine sediment metagenome TaxID=412755 RepID=A0A1B6NWV6_9ZZZZ